VEICKQNSCLKFDWASDLEQRNKLWLARHHVWFALKALNPGRKV
jgi:FAD/FMN-containing dehydrogenase